MRKSVGNRKIIMSDEIRAGDYAGGRKIGSERVKDQEKRHEQENHNVGRGPT
jgi:hypothetical protein